MTVPPRVTRGCRWAALSYLLLICASPLHAQPAANPPPQASSDTPDVESVESPGAVLVGGEPVVWLTTGVGPYSPQTRADRITQRIEEIVGDGSIGDPRVVVVESDNGSELRIGARLLMVVSQQDARSIGRSRSLIAAEYARELERAIRDERLRYAPGTLIRSGLTGAAATVLLMLLLWALRRIARGLRTVLLRWQQRRLSLKIQQAELVSSESVNFAVERLLNVLSIVIVIVILNLYLTFVLGLFPWTRALSSRLLGYLLTPIGSLARALIGYLPNLLFVLVISGVIYLAIRLVRLFFDQIEQGRIVFKNFPPEWADPTNKIVRVLLIAFGLVIVFPYLPASDSAAFAGVSVFLGVLVSLSSSSAIANMVAGIVLTYTNAFRVGDRVKVGDAFGDIADTSLLATRIRTIKNEDITIPNTIVLSSAMTNFSRHQGGAMLILHTSVTIGYDAPWRQIHQLLIDAALSTPGLRHDPRPFVWQTALNDFYVTYEINAYTDKPHDMAETYAVLHARIQDTFYAEGVEIMSPHFMALREGNKIAIPPGSRAPGYEAAPENSVRT